MDKGKGKGVNLHNVLIKLEDVSTTFQGVHVMVKVHSPPNFFLFSAIYARNTFSDRIKLGDDLIDIASIFKGSWLVGVISMRTLN